MGCSFFLRDGKFMTPLYGLYLKGKKASTEFDIILLVPIKGVWKIFVIIPNTLPIFYFDVVLAK